MVRQDEIGTDLANAETGDPSSIDRINSVTVGHFLGRGKHLEKLGAQ